MKCPYCSEFKGNSKVRGYPVKDQLNKHIKVFHLEADHYRKTHKLSIRQAQNPDVLFI